MAGRYVGRDSEGEAPEVATPKGGQGTRVGGRTRPGAPGSRSALLPKNQKQNLQATNARESASDRRPAFHSTASQYHSASNASDAFGELAKKSQSARLHSAVAANRKSARRNKAGQCAPSPSSAESAARLARRKLATCQHAQALTGDKTGDKDVGDRASNRDCSHDDIAMRLRHATRPKCVKTATPMASNSFERTSPACEVSVHDPLFSPRRLELTDLRERR